MKYKDLIYELENLANKHGGKCLSDTYINSHTKYSWKCNNINHPSFLASHNNVKTKNSWCPFCRNEKTSERNKIIFTGKKFSNERNKKISNVAILHGFGKWMTGRILSKETKIKISKKNLGHSVSIETRKKISRANLKEKNGMYGKSHSTNSLKKLSVALSGPNHPQYGKPLSDEHKNKIRLTLSKTYANKFLNLGFKGPRINVNACKFIDKYGKEKGYNFQHGLNGGEYYIKEVGAWVDGYDENKNIVFEYDEKKHFDIYGNLKNKDIYRMNLIKNSLNCKFIRYNCLKKEIVEY